MALKKPRIGIAGNETHTAKGQVRCDLPYAYVEAVEAAGGLPLILPQVEDLELAEAQLDQVEGVLLPGGGDVHPLLAGEEPRQGLGGTFPFLDAFQIALTRKALERKMPLLGICKGMQVLNVALGGTLYQDLGECAFSALQHSQKTPYRYASHSVFLRGGSLLGRLWGERVEVNSFHHQGVKNLGKELEPVGHSRDGLVEAVEMEGEAFVVGVQWHPEEMWRSSEAMGLLFRRFVDAGRSFA